jgi:CheY-like chemotaxis protein
VTDSSKKCILVVDDDALNREIMEAFLAAEDYDVVFANNGATALQKAATLKPHLIILDVKMPDMTGYEVCKHLRRQAATRLIPIIIVTGFDTQLDQERAGQVGANAFLPRPFRGDELLAQVAQLLRL